MGYDDVLERTGEFGRYQRRIYFLLWLPAITCAFHKMGGVFLSAKTDFRCLLPEENSANASYSLPLDVMRVNFPWNNETESFSQCERYDLDFARPYNTSFGNRSIIKCESFVYDKSQYTLTATTEFDLVCHNSWFRATGDSLFMVGVMLGSIIFGGLSDRYGRRLSFFIALMVQLIGGILVAISPEVFSYMIFRLLVGSTTSGVFLVAYVIALEMVGPKKRLLAGMGCQLFFASGYILTAGLAYYIPNWRTLQIAFTIPTFTFLAYWWFIPESARWLLTKGRLQETKAMLQKASLINGVELSQDTLDLMLSNEGGNSKPDINEPSIFDLFKYPNLRRKSLLLFFVWFINSGTYYGLSWNTSNLGGNDYINFANAAAVEVPAYLFLLFTLDRWGRKIILCGSMIIAGASLVSTLFVPSHLPWLVVTLAMFGKLAITSSYGAVYVFASEQFPTSVRNVGLGACSTAARFGGIIAPYINHLAEIWPPLPLVIFGSSALITGFLTLFLPETLNKKLPESIQDGESFGKKNLQDMEKWLDVEAIKPLKTPEKILREKNNGFH